MNDRFVVLVGAALVLSASPVADAQQVPVTSYYNNGTLVTGCNPFAINMLAGATCNGATHQIDVSAGTGAGGVASVTASAPLASSGGANPNISFTGVLAIANGGTALSTVGGVGNAGLPLTVNAPGTAFTIATLAVGGGGTGLPSVGAAADLLIAQSATSLAARAVSGDIALASSGATTVGGLQGRLVSNAAPSDGSLLGWVVANNDWEPTSTLLATASAVSVGGGNIATSISTGTAAITFSSTLATARAGWRNSNSRNIVRHISGSVPDCANATLNLTVTQFLDVGIATCGQAETINFPSWQGASGIVQNLPGAPAAGDVVEFQVVDTSNGSPITVGPGAGGTIGSSSNVPAGNTKTYRCMLTSVVANSETATCY